MACIGQPLEYNTAYTTRMYTRYKKENWKQIRVDISRHTLRGVEKCA